MWLGVCVCELGVWSGWCGMRLCGFDGIEFFMRMNLVYVVLSLSV